VSNQVTGQGTRFPVQNDGEHVLFAVRLGWGVAELRGRNRPDGPPGDSARMPAGATEALPLRAERSPTELRIEVQTVVEYLARQLHVNEADNGMPFGSVIDASAQLLYHVRATRAARALQAAQQALTPAAGQPPNADAALAALHRGQLAQKAVVDQCQQAVAVAQATLTAAQNRVTELAGQPADEAADAAERAVAEATAALGFRQGACTGEETGLQPLSEAIADLQQAMAASAATAPEAAASAFTTYQAQLAQAAQQPWANLASLIWQFDAHIQDELAAQSETRAMGYQLGRGLSETYWALDRDALTGASGWSFLLGPERCGELTRLVGRLGSYMNEYTAPAVASSVQVWQAVAAADDWRGADGAAATALYMQVRRWFELIIIGQDPTTLVKPSQLFRRRMAGRAFRLFWPEFLGLVIGLAGLAFLILFLVHGGTALEKALSGLAAGIGAAAAGLAGAFKSAGQALFKRLRQGAYTDLIAVAVQTAPKPPQGNRQLRQALANRDLSPPTRN
jgi:hypothetical protein